jgi:hypothetical protein
MIIVIDKLPFSLSNLSILEMCMKWLKESEGMEILSLRVLYFIQAIIEASLNQHNKRNSYWKVIINMISKYQFNFQI